MRQLRDDFKDGDVRLPDEGPIVRGGITLPKSAVCRLRLRSWEALNDERRALMPHSPFHCGGRLFKNASMPSRKSWLR